MAEFCYFTGPMDCGKSTLALQLDHKHATSGRKGKLFTSHDRAGEATISSRLGLSKPAVEVGLDFDFWYFVVEHLTGGERIDYLVCDETQFYTARQVDQLARIVDELQIDVFAFGILTDFQTRLFPGSQRLVELGDRVEVLQVRGAVLVRRARHPQRPDDRRRDGHRGRPGDGRRHRHRRGGRDRVRGALPAAPPARGDQGGRPRDAVRPVAVRQRPGRGSRCLSRPCQSIPC